MQTTRMLIALLSVLMASANARAESIEKLKFQLDTKTELVGELNPTLTFTIQEPSQKMGWARSLKGKVRVSNKTEKAKFVYAAIALFDKEGKLLTAGGTSWMKDFELRPRVSYALQVDLALVGYRMEDISYASVRYVEGEKRLLEYHPDTEKPDAE